MLENIPIVSALAVEASKTKMKVPTPEELDRTLLQLRRSNPWLLKALINDIDSVADLFQDKLRGLPEGVADALRHHLIWRSLSVLDLIDRALFDAKMQEKLNLGVATTRTQNR